MKNLLYSKVSKLEGLLSDLSDSLKSTELKRYTANQYFKAENLNLAEGATLTINMNNALFSLKLVNECLQIVNDIKPYIPSNGNSLHDAIDFFKKEMVTKALVNNGFKNLDAAKDLGISFRQLRYVVSKDPEHFKKLKEMEKETCYGSNQEETA